MESLGFEYQFMFDGMESNDSVAQEMFGLFMDYEDVTLANKKDPDYIIRHICSPTVAGLGLLANVVNMVVLVKRYAQLPSSSLERSSICGLVALAIADFGFCLSVVPDAYVTGHREFYSSRDFHFHFTMYGVYFKDLFIKISTAITVMIAVTRCMVVCYPLKAKCFIGVRLINIVSVCMYIFWALLLLPLLWTLSWVKTSLFGSEPVYIIDNGVFSYKSPLSLVFSLVWSVLGYMVPLVILSVCNVKLILALRSSQSTRSLGIGRRYSAPTVQTSNRRLTITLVTLILLYIVMISPSEILHFVSEFAPFEHTARLLYLPGSCVNLLQTVFYSSNLLLYISVNSAFRRTFLSLFRQMTCIVTPEREDIRDVSLQVETRLSLTGSMAASLTTVVHSRVSRVSVLETML